MSEIFITIPEERYKELIELEELIKKKPTYLYHSRSSFGHVGYSHAYETIKIIEPSEISSTFEQIIKEKDEKIKVLEAKKRPFFSV